MLATYGFGIVSSGSNKLPLAQFIPTRASFGPSTKNRPQHARWAPQLSHSHAVCRNKSVGPGEVLDAESFDPGFAFFSPGCLPPRTSFGFFKPYIGHHQALQYVAGLRLFSCT